MNKKLPAIFLVLGHLTINNWFKVLLLWHIIKCHVMTLFYYHRLLLFSRSFLYFNLSMKILCLKWTIHWFEFYTVNLIIDDVTQIILLYCWQFFLQLQVEIWQRRIFHFSGICYAWVGNKFECVLQLCYNLRWLQIYSWYNCIVLAILWKICTFLWLQMISNSDIE